MSEPLRPQDPATIGGHRLLGRLGAGGMGVVYLARSHTGALAAVKVVHPELAHEEDFRTRFRREVAAARQVNSPWATPVTAAGPDDPVPWLATAFVPGPSLGDAVRRHGPLPAHSVRSLARMLAAALREVHAVGLIHRDVKPGNVLLAVDGPRLIDFGIARSNDQTALTSTGVVAGTPGYLSPEQAEARADELGPPSDVFSLGCLLAYSATGRHPFGNGTTAAMLYRTVHDEPDLDGIGEDGGPGTGGGPGTDSGPGTAGPGLLGLLRACLAKDPAQRPTAGQIESGLTEVTTPGGTWLPEPLVRDIAERSARMPALPDIEPTVASGPNGPHGQNGQHGEEPGTAAPTSRRRMLGLVSGAAFLAAAGGGTALWALTRDGEDPPGGDGPRWALGVHADLTGPGKAVGRAQEQGARLAVEQYNAGADKPFELGLRTADDGGAAKRTKAAAERLTHDRGVLAVLGPTTDATAVGAAATYDEALLPVLFVVAGGSDLTTTPCRSALHCRAHDEAVARRLAEYLSNEPGASRPGLLQDRTAATYSAASAGVINLALRDSDMPPYPRVIPSGLDDLGPPVQDILERQVDSFVYAGFAEGAAKVARELASAGFDGPRMGPQALVDPAFPKAAGAAAEGWLLVASFVDPSAAPGTETFSKDFRRRFGSDPGYFAAEAYDAANLAIREVVKATEGGRPPSRSRLVKLLRESTYQGITKPYEFDPENGEFGRADSFLYRVEDGGFRFRGPAHRGG